jgi:hypothetical protein
MKRQQPLPLVISLVLLVSCSPISEQELTSEKKAAIIEKIETIWDAGSIGLENLDVEPMFSYLSESEKTKIITYGFLNTDIQALKKQFKDWFDSPAAFKQKSIWDPVYYDFINDKAVLMTAIGAFETIGDTSSVIQPVYRAYTVLWIKESEDWKAINMHISQQ